MEAFHSPIMQMKTGMVPSTLADISRLLHSRLGQLQTVIFRDERDWSDPLMQRRSQPRWYQLLTAA